MDFSIGEVIVYNTQINHKL